VAERGAGAGWGGSFVEVTIKGHHTFADNLLRYYRDEQTQHYETGIETRVPTALPGRLDPD